MCGSKCEILKWKMQKFSGEGLALPRPHPIMRRGTPPPQTPPLNVGKVPTFCHSSPPHQRILDPSLLAAIREWKQLCLISCDMPEEVVRNISFSGGTISQWSISSFIHSLFLNRPQHAAWDCGVDRGHPANANYSTFLCVFDAIIFSFFFYFLFVFVNFVLFGKRVIIDLVL